MNNHEILREKQLAFHILTKCTLRCKLCSTRTLLYSAENAHYMSDITEIRAQIDSVFAIYDFIEDITLTGGETMLHKDLLEILQYLLKYQDQYNRCRIFTNGTIIPHENIINLIKNSADKIQIMIDHYGDNLSKHTWDIKKIAEENGLNIRIKNYSGDEQYCNGWIDYGSLAEYRNYTEEQLEKVFNTCHDAHWKSLTVFKDQLHLCDPSTFGNDFGYFKPAEDDFVDLFDKNIPIEEKKRKAKQLGTKAVKACQYCNGFDPDNSKRYSAAEQA